MFGSREAPDGIPEDVSYYVGMWRDGKVDGKIVMMSLFEYGNQKADPFVPSIGLLCALRTYGASTIIIWLC